jgi:hypothetical protein
MMAIDCSYGKTGYNLINREENINYSVIQEISYYFGDASISPEYHRSYSVIVTSNKVRIVVDSYGNILTDEEHEITNDQFDDIKNSLRKNGIRNCTLGQDENCTGGTTERVSFSDGKNEIFSGSIDHCGGEDTGNLCGDISSFAKDVMSLVPNLEDLLK